MPEPNFDRLLEPFPADVIEEKQDKHYISHDLIRERVIEATGNRFDWEVISVDYRIDGVIRVRQSSGEIPPVMIVTGKLTIPELGTRTGMGVQVLEAGAGEDTYKAAESDAFKRAAMAFGVALRQLYIETAEAKREQKASRQTPRNQESSRTTTSRQQTRHHAEVVPEPMTHEAFGDAVRKAIADKDGAGFAKLADHAGELVGRWIVLVKAAPDENTLEWIHKQIGRRGIADPILLEEIRRQQNKLGVAPSTAVRQARRENVLPGELFSADEIEAGREAADRLTQ